MIRFLAPLASGLLLLGAVCPTYAAPRNVLLARDRTEPVVAIDPHRPSTIIAGSNTNYDQKMAGGFPVGVFASHDGGRSFRSGPVPFIQPYSVGADPTVAFSRSGTAFFSYLGESPSYCGGGPGAVLLTTSVDGGRSFRSPTVVDSNSADDKPNLAVESQSRGRAHVFLTWTRWYNHRSEIWMARSVNGGDSFGAPAPIVSSRLDNFGSVPIVGPNGRIYVFWSAFPEYALGRVLPTQVLMRVSTDDGLHFGPTRVAVPTFPAIPRMAQPGFLRTLTMPAVVSGPAGILYLAFSAVTSHRSSGAVAVDIDLTYSRNGGRSWSAPVAVNDVHTGDRFMPSMSVMPDGSLGIAFYDRRNGGWELDVYAVHVVIDGVPRISQNVRLNQGPSPVGDIYYIKPGSTCFSPGRFFGDYIGTAADGRNRLCVVWADTQLQVYPRTDVWFARFKLPTVKQRAPRRRDDLWHRIGTIFSLLGSKL